MNRFFLLLCLVLPLVSCVQSKEDLSKTALELCQYIPDHELDPVAKDYMTPAFYDALSEAFDAPAVDYGEVGDNEWLFYFVSGNGGSRPSYTVTSVEKLSEDSAKASINVKDVWDESVGPEGEGADYEISLVRVDGKWLLDDFDGKKAQCIDYVKTMRDKYKSGKLVEYMESEEYLQEYIPDFQKRVADFFQKYGE